MIGRSGFTKPDSRWSRSSSSVVLVRQLSSDGEVMNNPLRVVLLQENNQLRVVFFSSSTSSSVFFFTTAMSYFLSIYGHISCCTKCSSSLNSSFVTKPWNWRLLPQKSVISNIFYSVHHQWSMCCTHHCDRAMETIRYQS